MKKTILVLAIFISTNSRALINATKIKSDFPIVKLDFKNNSHVCSGVFLNSSTILTAAHCISEEGGDWKNFSTRIASISDYKDNKVPVNLVKNIPHPKYTSKGWPKSKHDIGIIKIEPIDHFKSFPQVSSKASHKAVAYGCGQINLQTKDRKCLQGIVKPFNFMGYLGFWGKSKDAKNPGVQVSIAPNDSGGALVDLESGKIIGIHWGTWVTVTAKIGLSNLSFSTSLLNPKNYEFVRNSIK